MKRLLPCLILIAGLAACTSGPAEPDRKAAASALEPGDTTATTGISEPDLKALRPEREHTREILSRLKVHRKRR
jgi:hypothetical protein